LVTLGFFSNQWRVLFANFAACVHTAICSSAMIFSILHQSFKELENVGSEHRNWKHLFVEGLKI